MSYNLLLDTQFKNNFWKFHNCKYENGYLISTDKVFGIEQELVLSNPSKLYFRVNYRTENISIKDVKIGIQNNGSLGINYKTPKLNKNQYISVIDKTEEKIKLHVIFESNTKINKVYIEKPILVDLNNIHKITWIKPILDKVISYREGYVYNNLYKENEISYTNEDFKEYNIEKANIGSIIKTNKNIEIKLDAKFNRNTYYLVKLDFKEINRFGNIYFQYGNLKSTRIEEEQIYLLFKGQEETPLELIIEGKDIIDYKINLKHLLLIDITKMKLLKSDISTLPFIGE